MPRTTNLPQRPSVHPVPQVRPWVPIWSVGITYNGAIGDAGKFLLSSTRPQTTLVGGTQQPVDGLVVLPHGGMAIDPHAELRFRFWHQGGKTQAGRWAIWGITEIWPLENREVEFAGDLLLIITAGCDGLGGDPTPVPAAARSAPAGAVWCDSITVDDNYAPGTVEVDCDAVGGAANLVLRSAGYLFYALQGTRTGDPIAPDAVGGQYRVA